jgi:hypothetical protein
MGEDDEDDGEGEGEHRRPQVHDAAKQWRVGTVAEVVA